VVRGTVSPARAWRPAAGARLARTLGVTKHTSRRSLPQFSPQLHPKSQLPSHETLRKFHLRPCSSLGTKTRSHADRTHRNHDSGLVWADAVTLEESRSTFVLGFCGLGGRFYRLPVRPALARATTSLREERQSLSTKDFQSHRKTYSHSERCRFMLRCFGVSQLARTSFSAARVTPNPSLKRSANGRPPGPVWRYAVHFRQSGPGVLPSSPA
jgi:hypothetical protein